MSQFAYAILIFDKNINDIIDIVKKLKIQGYLFAINANWNVAIVENDDSNGESITETFSKKLKAYAIYFVNCEDYGWGYFLYYNGKRVDHLLVDYNRLSDEEYNISIKEDKFRLLRDLKSNNEILSELEKNLKIIKYDSNGPFNGVNLFKKALDIEKLEWISYRILNQKPDDDLIANGITIIRNNEKKSFNKILFDIVGNKLKEYGYYYEKNNPMSSDYAFFKNIDGIFVGLEVYKTDNIFNARIKTLYDSQNLFYATQGKGRHIECSNEDELRITLSEITDLFINKGIEIIDDGLKEKVNIKEIFEQKVDPFLKRYKFAKEYLNDNLLAGAKIEYKSESFKIVFEHHQLFTAVGCYIYKNGLLLEGLSSSNKSSFKNRYEYDKIIESFLDNIDRYLQNTY